MGDKIRAALSGRKQKSTDDPACSFCSKGRDRVQKLIAGPSVYICDECVDLCNDIITEEGVAPQESGQQSGVTSLAAYCVVCRILKPATELMVIPDAGYVCHPCADAIRAVADAELPPASDPSTHLTSGAASAEQPCKLCGIVLESASLLVLPDRGAVCGACLDAISAAVRRQHDSGGT